jgi:hypothetical protein
MDSNDRLILDTWTMSLGGRSIILLADDVTLGL